MVYEQQDREKCRLFQVDIKTQTWMSQSFCAFKNLEVEGLRGKAVGEQGAAGAICSKYL